MPGDVAAATFHGSNVKMSRSGRLHTVLAPEEARVRAIADIVNGLIQGIRDGKDVDLNDLKTRASRKYALARAPKLVEIIAVSSWAAPASH